MNFKKRAQRSPARTARVSGGGGCPHPEPAPRARPPRAPTLTGERLPSARGGPAGTRPERRCPGGARCVRTSTGPRPRGCGQPFPRHCRPRTCSSVAWSPGGGVPRGHGARACSALVCAARSFLRRPPPSSHPIPPTPPPIPPRCSLGLLVGCNLTGP